MFWVYVPFLAFVLMMLVLDLGVFHRESHEVGMREALIWTGIWVSCALLFNVLVYFIYEYHWWGIGQAANHETGGRTAALQFLTGYLIEESLSLDNIFIIALIFQYFAVPLKYQHRVLFWGILGAVVLRGLAIGIGITLIRQFDWMVYVFGGLLLVTAGRMLVGGEERVQPERNPLVHLVRRWFPVIPQFRGEKFFVRENGGWAVTPLFLTLVLVESSDILFAVDSIPAIFAITQDPFLVFTSNIFAILGLRSLYFVLAALVQKFQLLKYSLVVLLGFVGVKMLLSHHVPISTTVSLAVIVGVLGVGIIASLLHAERQAASLAEMWLNGAEPPLSDGAYRQLRHGVVLLIGISMMGAVIAIIMLPAWAAVVIPTGLLLLAGELVWARWLFRQAKHSAPDRDRIPPDSS